MLPSSVLKYGLEWKQADALQIEMSCIRMGGRWTQGGREWGNGLSFHYEQMRKLLWPDLDCHRWHELCRDAQINNKVVILLGAASTAKTHSAAWFRLCEYFCFPEETLVLVSSTTLPALKLRVWGEIVGLWGRAIRAYSYLPGNLLESRTAICTDELSDSGDDRMERDMRKGIVGVPTLIDGKFVGLAKWVGVKQKRIRVVGDELQFMGASFLSAFSNLNQNVDFRATVMGNPSDPMDPLGMAAEPIDGWSGHMEPAKTETWRTRFMDGFCVNLVGTDSPNFDGPSDQPARYKYLVSREKIKEIETTFGADSWEYWSQCKGVMKSGMLQRRVITRDLCRKFKAQESVIWSGTPRIKIGGLDAAYGGDRCICGHIEFGFDVDGLQVIQVCKPSIVPIRISDQKTAEEQIAIYVRDYCMSNGIVAENFYHDSTGRGTLGTMLARAWSDRCNPVEFGGSPTERPVSLDIYVYDTETKRKRLKTCREHYSKFVTELWYTVRYAIEAEQIRDLPTDVMEEGCMREWRMVSKSRRELETKDEMKERTKRSPDLFDWLSICVEGARQRGFAVKKLANDEMEPISKDWTPAINRMKAIRQAGVLDHST